MASPSAAAVEITGIFQKILANNLTYCALCLRTEEERKLVEPKAFMKCLAVMRLRVPVVNTICYICEAQAARAVSLFQAISFATSVNRWFKDRASKLKCNKEMPSHLDRYMGAQTGTWPQSVGLRAPPLPQAWAVARGRCDLVQTEVLLVSDAMPAGGRNVVEVSLGPARPAPPPGQIPLEIKHNNISEPDLDSIVIIDDEDPPTPPPLAALPSASAMPPIVTVEELLQHPHPGAVAVVPNEMQLLSRHKDGQNFVLHPIVTGSDGGHYVPSLSAQLLNGALVYVDPANIRYVDPVPQETSTLRNILDKKIAAKKDRSPAKPAALPAPPSAPASRQAVMIGRIDWEDKIPMDVISFVDATDPNADQILQPASPGPPTLKRRHLDRDVIDLC